MLGVVVIGSLLGLAAGFLRGWTDRILMTLFDAILAFPGILLALALIAVLGSGREQHRAGADHRLSARCRARGTQHGALHSRARIHPGLQARGRQHALHHGPPRAAERSATSHSSGNERLRLGAAFGERAELSGCGCSRRLRLPGATCCRLHDPTWSMPRGSALCPACASRLPCWASTSLATRCATGSIPRRDA